MNGRKAAKKAMRFGRSSRLLNMPDVRNQNKTTNQGQGESASPKEILHGGRYLTIKAFPGLFILK